MNKNIKYNPAKQFNNTSPVECLKSKNGIIIERFKSKNGIIICAIKQTQINKVCTNLINPYVSST